MRFVPVQVLFVLLCMAEATISGAREEQQVERKEKREIVPCEKQAVYHDKVEKREARSAQRKRREEEGLSLWATEENLHRTTRSQTSQPFVAKNSRVNKRQRRHEEELLNWVEFHHTKRRETPRTWVAKRTQHNKRSDNQTGRHRKILRRKRYATPFSETAGESCRDKRGAGAKKVLWTKEKMHKDKRSAGYVTSVEDNHTHKKGAVLKTALATPVGQNATST
ncbi:uncharacterized protein LOC106167644 [Lingula anatina]|uniref:Uncharacterized protein LOC106167644 n=1 Tax=Lingula anatina TaxID=7574 RepID=A0A1S3IVE8_LINAN|nr:uncharacterized protein LOC106167644 [Lingula anatina]|eukprot:XP_013401936.1 uncharacterized protein LOC106167644 [Lingula anatina]